MSVTLKNVANADLLYGLFRTAGDRSEYIGPNHSDIAKDALAISSSSPKRNATTYGNRRSTIKLIRSVTVATPDGGTETKDARIEISISLPVGISNSARDELQVSLLSLPAATFDSIASNGQTQF